MPENFVCPILDFGDENEEISYDSAFGILETSYGLESKINERDSSHSIQILKESESHCVLK